MVSKTTKRRQARSRFSRRYYGPQPKFQVGDQAGEFNVIEYKGHSRVKPDGDPKVLSQEHHWYAVRCSCGTEEVHTQQQLIDTRRHRACVTCIEKLSQPED